MAKQTQKDLIDLRLEEKAIEKTDYVAVFQDGRISVLEDFDNMCKADAFVGFTDDEWSAVKKFFAINSALTGKHGS